MARSPRRARATIADVAKHAVVSTATVSRVLSGVAPVSEEARARVLVAVEELSYRPSELTRAVFAGHSNAIGVLVADMRNPYYNDLLDGISQVANGSGTLPYLAAGNRNRETERRLLSLMDSHHVRGLVTTVAEANDDLIQRMASAGTECVYMTHDPAIDHPRIHSVRLDDRATGRIAWSHLAEQGRTNVLIVNQSRDSATTHPERMEGMIEAAHRCGVTLTNENVFTLDSLDQPSEELTRFISDAHRARKLDAVFATTGISTYRAYESLIRTGLSIPREIAILGLDDFPWAEFLSPSLSVIVQPTVKMGETAARLILDGPGKSQRRTFEPSIAIRESTRT